MLITTRRRYMKQHVIGGAGIFDTVANFFRRLFTSNAARQIASTALSVGKNAAAEIGKKAVDVGKNAVIDAGKKLVDKVFKKTEPQVKKTEPQGTPSKPPPITQEMKDVLTKLINEGATMATTNINNLMMGSGNAIAIQDLVRRLNGHAKREYGAGMKMTNI